MLNSPQCVPSTPPTPATPFSHAHSPSLSSSSSSGGRSQRENVETGSCSPAPLYCSFDSGISFEANEMQQTQRKLKDCERILHLLERDKEMYRVLRERLSKLVDRKNKKQLQQQREINNCNVCCAKIVDRDAKSSVLCSICNELVCRNSRCANRRFQSAQWECQTCHSSQQSLAHTSSWVAEQMSFNQHKFVYPMRARSEICIPISDHNDSNSMIFESVSQVGAASNSTAAIGAGSEAGASISNEQKLKIREYVEELVAEMLGGSLDSVTVGQMSKSEGYLPALVNGHHLTSSNTSINNVLHTNHNNNTTFIDVSQTRLRQLIETIIAETLRFPVTLTTSSAISEVSFETHRNCGNRLTLSNGDAKQRHRTEHYFEPKIYQELLATAVLNKIADKHGNVHRLSESSPDFTTPDANQNFKDNPKSSSSGSSIGPRSDFSFTDNDQNLLNLSKGDDFSPYGSHSNLNTDGTTLQLDAGRESALSDYIAAHLVPLPDLSAPATESEEDDYNSATSNQVGEGNWEDNWLFKKKKTSLSSSVTVGSVGMLVPAPKDDVRAQIGDKIADDISDLSEMGSDTDDSSLELLRDQLDPLNDRLLNKHLIGGKNTKLVLDELMERTSMMSNTTLGDNEPIYTETKNEQVCKSTTANPEAINKDVTKSILQSSPPSIDTMTEPSEPVILLPPCNFDDEGNISTFSEDLDTINTTAGSIAEREYKKWYNAVDMPNNPYAPDALKRRISGSQEKYIDLPNISPSTDHNPISLMESESENEVVQVVPEQGRDYKRYSRDYYINDTKVGSIKPKTLSVDSEQPDITVNEVNRKGFDRVDDNRPSNTSNHSHRPECHWTLSTPMRRSSSLKYINRNSPETHYFTTSPQTPPPLPKTQPPRAATSTSLYTIDSTYEHQHSQNEFQYNDYNNNSNNQNEKHNIRDFEMSSRRSWTGAAATLPKRRSQSSLSCNSYSNKISATNKKYDAHPSSTSNILSLFEKQLLHKDLKRNSFRAVSSTTKDFVLNPVFDQDNFYGSCAKLSLKSSLTDDHRSDSGVDSSLNGFSDIEARNTKNCGDSLLF